MPVFVSWRICKEMLKITRYFWKVHEESKRVRIDYHISITFVVVFFFKFKLSMKAVQGALVSLDSGDSLQGMRLRYYVSVVGMT